MEKIKINFKQPKYILPAILYPLLLATGYFFIDMFHTKKADLGDPSMQVTEYLNPYLPQPKVKDDLGGKYENMLRSYGRIDDLTAVDNIDREDKDADKEEYESKYSDDERQAIDDKAAPAECRPCRRPAATRGRLPFPAHRERAAHPEPAAGAGLEGGTRSRPSAVA